MKRYSIDEILSALKEIANECDRVTSGNISHEMPKIKMDILNWCRIAEEQQFGWRPASEAPNRGKDGDFILTVQGDNRLGWRENVDGSFGDIPFHFDKLWCYLPEEYKVRP